MLLAEPIKQVPSPTRTSTTRRSPYYKAHSYRRPTSLVWAVWVVAAFACLGSGDRGRHPVDPVRLGARPIRNLASLAVLYLLLSAEFVAAAQVLVYAGAVTAMFLFVIAYLGERADAPWAGGSSSQRRRGPRLGRAVRRGIARRSVLKTSGRLCHQRRSAPPLAARRTSGGSSSPTICSRSRSPRSSSSSRRSAASSSACPPVRGRMCPGSDGPRRPLVPLHSQACLSVIGALASRRRSPLIGPLSLEIMLNGAQPRARRLLAPLRPRPRSGLRPHRDGRRCVRGSRRRSRPHRRDPHVRSLPLDVDKLSTLRG